MNLISSQMSVSPKLETSQADRSFRVYSSPQTIQQFINNIYNSLRANGLGSDQARLSIGPDMGPNCLQRLSTYKGCRLQDSRTSSTFEPIHHYPTAMNSIFIWKERNCHF